MIILTLILENELMYLNEWITFHEKQGVNLFYIYLAYKTNEYKVNIPSYPDNVKIIQIKFSRYCHIFNFFKNYYQKHLNDWMAIIDIDEFLYSPLKDKKITDIIDIYEREKKYAIGVNWKCFGSNGIIENFDKKIIHKFTKCAEKYHGINTVVKSLFKISVIDVDRIKKSNIHKYVLKKGFKYYTTNGNNFISHNNKNIHNLSKIRKSYLSLFNNKKKNKGIKKNYKYLYPEENPYLIINHYIVRSKEEFLLKIKNNKNREDRYNLKIFNIYNNFLNEVENKDILDKI